MHVQHEIYQEQRHNRDYSQDLAYEASINKEVKSTGSVFDHPIYTEEN